MPRKLSPDKWLFAVTVALVLFGIVMVNSASALLNNKQLGIFSYAFLHQSVVALLGLSLMWIFMRINYRRYNNAAVVFSGLGLCLVLLLLVLRQGPSANVHRWLQWGPLGFQPSEAAKLTMVLFMAGFLSRRGQPINQFSRGLLPYFLVVGLFAWLIMIEPDLGTAACLLIVAVLMLFTAGLRWRYLISAAAAASIALAAVILRNPYQLQRMLTFFFGDGADRLGAGYQITQSLIAIGSGGITGLGLGDGKQKLFFLPQPHTDFIFSVIGEEFGLIGTTLVSFLFLVFFWRGLKAAVRAPDRFGFFLALGLTLLIVVQAFINMGVVLKLLPTKGIPLPFVSMGGSSIIVSLVAVGILLNVSQYSSPADLRSMSMNSSAARG
ncbi:MAG: putative lipid II flippase FtsW [Acidobacteria bacterium]|nr:putative lipid II flippase FtsW [Acidobacteriota bacterium]MBI3657800.1 putative lipid II flippase FtsW [Acidobacteriota bacterium]